MTIGLLRGIAWMHSEFVGFAYYVAASGALLLLALCGAWFLIGMSGARWALRVAAVIVALFVVLNASIPWSNAPFYGGHDVAFYAYLVLVVALCAVTFFIGGSVRPNLAVDTDARGRGFARVAVPG